MINTSFNVLNFLKDLFLLKYLPNLGTNASYGLLFAFGIMTSFHCLGMCGGIALSQTVRKVQDKGQVSSINPHKFFVPSILYNLGRVISYTLVGGIVGGLGSVVGFTGALKGIIPIIGGLFMIVMAINLLGVFPFLRRFNVTMPLIFAKKIKNGKNYGPLFVGLMSGLMPCGPLQIVEIYALGTRSVLFGALSMFFFSLGTVPILFIFGAVNSVINKKQSTRILKASSILVLVLGIVMVGRGLSLFGVSLDLPTIAESKHKGTVAVISGNIQTVTTEIKSDRFYPIVVQKGVPVKWTIKADAENLNECNSAITISKLKIEKNLTDGDNVIEFTPLESDEIGYTCWMGMIKSEITVVDDIEDISTMKK